MSPCNTNAFTQTAILLLLIFNTTLSAPRTLLANNDIQRDLDSEGVARHIIEKRSAQVASEKDVSSDRALNVTEYKNSTRPAFLETASELADLDKLVKPSKIPIKVTKRTKIVRPQRARLDGSTKENVDAEASATIAESAAIATPSQSETAVSLPHAVLIKQPKTPSQNSSTFLSVTQTASQTPSPTNQQNLHNVGRSILTTQPTSSSPTLQSTTSTEPSTTSTEPSTTSTEPSTTSTEHSTTSTEPSTTSTEPSTTTSTEPSTTSTEPSTTSTEPSTTSTEPSTTSTEPSISTLLSSNTKLTTTPQETPTSRPPSHTTSIQIPTQQPIRRKLPGAQTPTKSNETKLKTTTSTQPETTSASATISNAVKTSTAAKPSDTINKSTTVQTTTEIQTTPQPVSESSDLLLSQLETESSESRDYTDGRSTSSIFTTMTTTSKLGDDSDEDLLTTRNLPNSFYTQPFRKLAPTELVEDNADQESQSESDNGRTIPDVLRTSEVIEESVVSVNKYASPEEAPERPAYGVELTDQIFEPVIQSRKHHFGKSRKSHKKKIISEEDDDDDNLEDEDEDEEDEELEIPRRARPKTRKHKSYKRTKLTRDSLSDEDDSSQEGRKKIENYEDESDEDDSEYERIKKVKPKKKKSSKKSKASDLTSRSLLAHLNPAIKHNALGSMYNRGGADQVRHQTQHQSICDQAATTQCQENCAQTVNKCLQSLQQKCCICVPCRPNEREAINLSSATHSSFVKQPNAILLPTLRPPVHMSLPQLNLSRQYVERLAEAHIPKPVYQSKPLIRFPQPSINYSMMRYMPAPLWNSSAVLSIGRPMVRPQFTMPPTWFRFNASHTPFNVGSSVVANRPSYTRPIYKVPAQPIAINRFDRQATPSSRPVQVETADKLIAAGCNLHCPPTHVYVYHVYTNKTSSAAGQGYQNTDCYKMYVNKLSQTQTSEVKTPTLYQPEPLLALNDVIYGTRGNYSSNLLRDIQYSRGTSDSTNGAVKVINYSNPGNNVYNCRLIYLKK